MSYAAEVVVTGAQRIALVNVMSLQPKLQQQVAHKLILTPALQQAIKLLPLSTVELSDLLNQEIVV